MRGVLIVLFLLTSCASNKKHFTISEESLDSLRNESLYRHDEKRLSEKYSASELIMCHQGKISEALEKFEKQLDSRSKDPLYWSHIGTCYYLKAEFPKAKFYYQLAMNYAKSKDIKASIFNNLGLIFLKYGKFHEATEHFQEAIKLNPEVLTPHFNITQIYIQHRHYSKAQEKLNLLLSKAPADVDFNYHQAHLYLMTGKYEKARSQFARIPKQYLKRQDIANNYSMLLYLMGDYKLSQEILSGGDKTGPLNVLNARVEIEKKLREKLN